MNSTENYIKMKEVFSIEDGKHTVTVDCFNTKHTCEYIRCRREKLLKKFQQQNANNNNANNNDSNNTDAIPTTCFFLSHYHSDHYQDIHRNFLGWPYGKVFCSKITANLIRLTQKRLREEESNNNNNNTNDDHEKIQIEVLENNIYYRIDVKTQKILFSRISQQVHNKNENENNNTMIPVLKPHEIDVVCIDANHAPGSLIFVVHSVVQPVVVHVGDFRYDGETKTTSRSDNDDAVHHVKKTNSNSSSPQKQQQQQQILSSKNFFGLKQAPTVSKSTSSRRISSSLGNSYYRTAEEKKADFQDWAQRQEQLLQKQQQQNQNRNSSSASASASSLSSSTTTLFFPQQNKFPFSVYPKIGDHPEMQAIRQRVGTLFLDNTYCDPKYSFVSQYEALTNICQDVASKISEVVGNKIIASVDEKHIKNENKMKKKKKKIRICLCVGAYAIGKERLALALHSCFGNRIKFFVNSYRQGFLNACEMPCGDCNNTTNNKFLDDEEDSSIFAKQQQDNKSRIVYQQFIPSLHAKNNKNDNISGDQQREEVGEQTKSKTNLVDPEKTESIFRFSETLNKNNRREMNQNQNQNQNYHDEMREEDIFWENSLFSKCSKTSLENFNDDDDDDDIEISLSCFITGMGTFSYKNISGTFSQQQQQQQNQNEDTPEVDNNNNNREQESNNDNSSTTTTADFNKFVIQNELIDDENMEVIMDENETEQEMKTEQEEIPPSEENNDNNNNNNKSQKVLLFPLSDEFSIDLNDFDSVISLSATGWSNSQSPSQCTRSYYNNHITTMSRPYSEHSSFAELLNFVEFLQPCKIIPTVSEKQYKAMENLFLQKSRRIERPIFFKKVETKENNNSNNKNQNQNREEKQKVNDSAVVVIDDVENITEKDVVVIDDKTSGKKKIAPARRDRKSTTTDNTATVISDDDS